MDSSVDCHATAGAVSRNDRKRALLLEWDFYQKWILVGKAVFKNTILRCGGAVGAFNDFRICAVFP